MLLGYSVVRFAPEEFKDGSAFSEIGKLLATKEEQS